MRKAIVVVAGVMGAAVVVAAVFVVLAFAGLYTISPGVSGGHPRRLPCSDRPAPHLRRRPHRPRLPTRRRLTRPLTRVRPAPACRPGVRAYRVPIPWRMPRRACRRRRGRHRTRAVRNFPRLRRPLLATRLPQAPRLLDQLARKVSNTVSLPCVRVAERGVSGSTPAHRLYRPTVSGCPMGISGPDAEGPPPFSGGASAMYRFGNRYPVSVGTPRTAAAGAAADGAAADDAAAGPGGPDGPGGVTGAAAQRSSSLVSLGLPGPSSSPPAPRNLDPVWQFECTSPLASGSGLGVAPATEIQPAEAVNAAAATRVTNVFFIRSPSRIGLFVLLTQRTVRKPPSVTGREEGTRPLLGVAERTPRHGGVDSAE